MHCDLGPAFCRLAAGSDDGGTKCLAHGSDGASLKMLRVCFFDVVELQSLQFGFKRSLLVWNVLRTKDRVPISDPNILRHRKPQIINHSWLEA